MTDSQESYFSDVNEDVLEEADRLERLERERVQMEGLVPDTVEADELEAVERVERLERARQQREGFLKKM